MELLSTGFVTVANGIWGMVTNAMSPITAAVVMLAAALAWLAAVDIENLNREGTKPGVERH